ncbi:thioredoxin family protein [Candidatus Eisenbacteria bacterium]|uniref:Thioredoxin family protein n=1 Tax=Eiseniibacteriota bacterium TaxID=2212470 RepID=A0ABV6YPS0_UNCEI
MVDVRQIWVGGVKVGLADLDRILKQVASESIDSDDVLAARLLDLVGQASYVAPSRSEEYKLALLREFKRSRGEDVPPEPGVLEIRVLGPGCPRCERLLSQVRTVLSETEINADLIRMLKEASQ